MPLLLENRVFRNERIVLDQQDLNALSVGLRMENCEIEIRVPAKRLSIRGVVMEGCVVRTKSPLINFQGWLGCTIRNTRFEGVYKGNDFGVVDWTPEAGAAESLDFSNAILDLCRVQGVPTQSFAWPKWPCFTVLDPKAHMREIVPPFAPWFSEMGEAPPRISAICMHAPGVLKFLGDTTLTVEELRARLPDEPWLIC